MIPANFYLFFRNMKARKYKNVIRYIFNNITDHKDFFEFIDSKILRVETRDFSLILRRISLFARIYIITDYLERK